ncbi:MAG: MarR family transcriptional regulator [Nitrospirae bacterium]|nr:MarR family transcriptional regulator [Nitrospirota bacterium]
MLDDAVRKDARKIQDSLEKVHRRLFSRILGELNKNKISIAQYNLLSVLADEGVCKMSRVAGCLYVTTSAVTAMTDRLVKKKMVRRRRSRRDRRIVEIEITDEGKDIVVKIRRQIEDFYIPILESLGRKKSGALVKLQEKMCRIIGCSEI